MKNLKLPFTLAATLTAATLWGATETVDGYTWTYSVVGDGAAISGNWSSPAISPRPTGSIAIPSLLGGKPVMCIGHGAFSNCTNLTSVTIPESVTNIGGEPFIGCANLGEIVFKGIAPQIDSFVFYGGSNLSCVRMENDLPPQMFYEPKKSS